MTELTGPEESSAQPTREWPLLATAAIRDPLVADALAGLEGLPDSPVEDHEEAYALLHDGLLDALNAKPQDLNADGLTTHGPAVQPARSTDGGA